MYDGQGKEKRASGHWESQLKETWLLSSRTGREWRLGDEGRDRLGLFSASVSPSLSFSWSFVSPAKGSVSWNNFSALTTASVRENVILIESQLVHSHSVAINNGCPNGL